MLRNSAAREIWARFMPSILQHQQPGARPSEGTVVWKQKPEAALMYQALKGLRSCLETQGMTLVSAHRTHALPLLTKKERDGLASYFENTLTS